MRTLLWVILLTSLATITCTAQVAIKVTTVAKDLTAPVAMDAPKDGSKRLFICEQTGKIKVIKNGTLLEKPLVDLKSKLDDMSQAYSEKGLLGIACHPGFKTNGRMFIYLSAPSNNKTYDHKDVVAELKVNPGTDQADISSYKVILEIDHPESNHNGGQLAFGPDGYLYIGIGDGGGGGDQHGTIGNGQSLNTLLGKILRIDVDKKSPYTSPADNPFVKTKNARPEIWAYGLRNPWRFSFDKKTGRLFCADVGQNKWEEINIIEKGKNYGWRIREGRHCYEPATGCETKGLTDPVAEYGHDKGVSVTGGYVYRGSNSSLQGKYIFGDWKGTMYYLEGSGGAWQLRDLAIDGKKDNDLDMNINSFGEDEAGNVYILAQKFTGSFTSTGVVYLLN